MRTALLIATWLAAGCGRLYFDGTGDDEPPDAPPPDGVDANLLEGCLLYLALDEVAWTGAPGEVEDKCGGGHHGTASGGATTIDDPQRGRVGAFVGDPSCVQIADASAIQPTTALTMSAWINPMALAPSSFGVISKRIDFGNNSVFSMFVWTDNTGGAANQIYVDLDTENDRVVDPTTTYLDTWRQVTVVYDGAQVGPARVRFYVDGAITFTATETSATIAAVTPDPPLSIGCLPLTTPAQSFVGRIDDVAVWSRALSAAEVQSWHDATK